MPGQKRFRILTPDGLLSHDTFVLPATQPQNSPAGCVRVIHEQSGTMLTVHDTRLFPAGATASASFQKPMSACLKCGRVTGVTEDEVTCSTSNDGTCGMLHPPPDTTLDVPFSSPP
jgi:hypothetical protein